MVVAVCVEAVLLLASWALFVVHERGHARERARLINAIVADTPAEYVALERVTTARPPKRRPATEATPAVPIGMA